MVKKGRKRRKRNSSDARPGSGRGGKKYNNSLNLDSYEEKKKLTSEGKSGPQPFRKQGKERLQSKKGKKEMARPSFSKRGGSLLAEILTIRKKRKRTTCGEGRVSRTWKRKLPKFSPTRKEKTLKKTRRVGIGKGKRKRKKTSALLLLIQCEGEGKSQSGKEKGHLSILKHSWKKISHT